MLDKSQLSTMTELDITGGGYEDCDYKTLLQSDSRKQVSHVPSEPSKRIELYPAETFWFFR